MKLNLISIDFALQIQIVNLPASLNTAGCPKCRLLP
jgi:hypothetical protein